MPANPGLAGQDGMPGGLGEHETGRLPENSDE